MSSHSSAYSSAEESFDSDEPPQLELDLDKLKDCAGRALKTTCIDAKRLTRGSNHEVFVLQFDQEAAQAAPEALARSGFSCIARFAREKSEPTKYASELATARYLKRFTRLPVPEIYYQDLDPDNDIGAPYALMEKMPGVHLYKMWDKLSLQHKKAALSQVASIVVQLALLKFDLIGCLGSGGVGPLISPYLKAPAGPFSSTLGYLEAFVSDDDTELLSIKKVYGEVRDMLGAFFSVQTEAAYLQPPFCMIHADFDGQNMLFMPPAADGDSAPKLTGLIDFEYAHTGPLYYLYEYPIFVQDVSWSKHLYADNAVLRAHFVHEIYQQLPSTEARETFVACMNAKTFLLNELQQTVMANHSQDPESIISGTTDYIKRARDGTGPAYSGRLDYVPEYYSVTGEPLLPAPQRPEELKLSPFL